MDSKRVLITLLLTGTWLAGGPFEPEPVSLQSPGALAFSPVGVLFAADPKAAAVYAFDIEDEGEPASTGLVIADLSKKLASLMGSTPDGIYVSDLAVHPRSRAIYLSVSRGGFSSNYLATQVDEGAVTALVRIGSHGDLKILDLEAIPHTKAVLENPPESGARLWGIPSRTFTITDLAFLEDTLLVAGLSNEEFSSRLYQLPFPFKDAGASLSVEVYHTSHGRYETHAPIRTLIPLNIGQEPFLAAAYTCTPLVVLPLAELNSAAAKVRGRTAAELGARNTPIDLAAYRHNGEDYLLVANNRHPLMRVKVSDLAQAHPLTSPTQRGGVAIDHLALKNVRRIAPFGQDQLLALQRGSDGHYQLKAIAIANLLSSD